MIYSISNSEFYGPLVVSTALAFIATITTVVRFLARMFKGTGIELDDYFIFSAPIFIYIMLTLQYMIIIIGGGGRHVNDVQPSDLTKTLKMLLPIEIIYSMSLAAIKLGILSFYLRIFGTRRLFRKLAHAIMVIVVLWVLSVILETILLCRPFARNWDLTIKGGVCGDRPTVYFSAGVLNIIIDFMVLVLPIYEIWQLELNKQQKWGLMIMFSFGILVSAISIVRLKSVQRIKFDDATYYLPMPIMWSLLEAELGIIIANLPMFRLFLTTVCAGWSEPSTIEFEAIKRPKLYRRADERSLRLTSADRAFRNDHITSPKPNHYENSGRPEIHVVRSGGHEG